MNNMNPPYNAVVFDMDGVLTDTEKVYRQCWTMNGMSEGLTAQQMKAVCDRLAGGTRATNALVVKEYLGEDFDYIPFRKKTMDMFQEYIDEHGIDLKSNVVSTLTELKRRGVKMALATSTDRQKAVDRLTRTGLIDFFDETVCGDEVERGKPHPDIYLKACEKLKVSPDRAVAVEDSVNGVISASDAGLCTVMVVDLIMPNDTTNERTDKTCYNIKEILELF